jgi:ABC-type bacteriocin/lantibiotic exporter with double-glycine peptidase domain
MATKTKEPLSKGVAKVPVIIQMEALECGAASLAMVLAYYDKWIPLSQVRQDCGVSRDGSNLKNIYLAAQNYGLEPHAFLMNPELLMEQGAFLASSTGSSTTSWCWTASGAAGRI